MSEMFERCVRAVHESDGIPVSMAKVYVWTILKAICEPTEAMIDVGQHVNSEWLNDNAPIGERRYRDPAKAVFTSMINEVLK